MEFVTIGFISLAVLCALFIAYFQYFFKNKEKSQFNNWLFFLRFFTLLSIFILFINPSFKKTKTTIVKPNLLVAIDNSSSIKYNKNSGKIEKLISELKKNSELNEKFNLNYFSFGDKVRVLDTLVFNESTTNLTEPLIEFSKIFTEKNSPTIIISDGNQTVGNNLASIIYKNPVYAFVVGDTTSTEDLEIAQVNINKFSYINNKFPVEVFVNYKGNKTVTKQLHVSYKGKRIISEKMVFSANDNVQIASFFLDAVEEGNQNYTISIENLENEKNTNNNLKTVSIHILKEQSKIAIISSIVHPDLGTLKKSIESSKQRTVSLLNPNNIKEDLSNFQLVILYQPNNNFKSVVQNLKLKNINYFVVSGTKTDWNFLNTNQQLFSKKLLSQSENYSSELNKDYTSFQLADIGFSNFAPLEDFFGEVKFNGVYNTLLFQKLGNISTKKALLATFEDNGRKGGVLLGEGLWKWRMNSYAIHKSFEPFDGFMANLVQFLASNTSSNRLQAHTESLFYANESILLTANYLDENYNFDNRAKLWLTVSNKKTNFLSKIPLSVGSHGFFTELNKLVPGDYNYLVTVENQPDSASGTFTILPFEIEQQYSNASDSQLKIVAKNTDGFVFYEQQGKELMAKLLDENSFKSIQKSSIEKTPLIDFKWLLGLVILLLSVEWFVRKYYGKI